MPVIVPSPVVVQKISFVFSEVAPEIVKVSPSHIKLSGPASTIALGIRVSIILSVIEGHA